MQSPQTINFDMQINDTVMIGIPLFLAVLFAAVTLSMTITVLLKYTTEGGYSSTAIYITLITLGVSSVFFSIAHAIRLTSSRA